MCVCVHLAPAAAVGVAQQVRFLVILFCYNGWLYASGPFDGAILHQLQLFASLNGCVVADGCQNCCRMPHATCRPYYSTLAKR